MKDNDVRTFRAESMQAALDLVRRELGPEAVILHTREVPQSRFFPWKRTKDKVEITAGTGMNVRTPRAILQAQQRQAPQALPAPPRERQRPVQDELLAPPPSFLPDRSRIALAPSAPVNAPHFAPAEYAPRQQAGSSMEARVPQPEIPSAPAARSPRREDVVTQEQHAALSRQLSSIQKLVEKLSRETRAHNDDVPRELFELYTKLIDAELGEDLARELTCQLKDECSPDELANANLVRSRLQSLVTSELKVAPSIKVTPGKRKVVALVGPTGVGKTTTIAKLAANFRLRDGIRMGLVTVDTYRVAAVEQLRTYAEIIDLPMKVVTSPQEMRRALDELMGLDLILIDTAGRSPRDELKIQELKSLLAEAQVDEVHLVLSLTASLRNLSATAAQFVGAGATSLILTKLDEAVGMGALLSVAKQISLPVSYLTMGQDVPDDIEASNAQRMARLILGEESVASGPQFKGMTRAA